jgi:hypothetical protein
MIFYSTSYELLQPQEPLVLQDTLNLLSGFRSSEIRVAELKRRVEPK